MNVSQVWLNFRQLPTTPALPQLAIRWVAENTTLKLLPRSTKRSIASMVVLLVVVLAEVTPRLGMFWRV
jgi:hypothetical protein